MSYYDPQGTRRSHQLKYTRKGQVIQAKLVNTPRTIETNLIPMYRQFFLNNPQYGLTVPPPINYPYNILGIVFGQPGSENEQHIFSEFIVSNTFQNSGPQTLVSAAQNKTFAISYIKAEDGFFFAAEGFNIGSTAQPISITPPNGTYVTYPCTSHSLILSKPANVSHIFLVAFLFNNSNKPDSSIGTTGFSHDPRSALDLDTWVFIPKSIYSF